MTRDARDYLVDLHRHALVATQIVAGRALEEFASDHIAILALERAVEIMGEAAGKLPVELRQKYPNVPWREMIGMRHRLAHAYFGTDLAILYEVAAHRLPTLVPILATIVTEESAS